MRTKMTVALLLFVLAACKDEIGQAPNPCNAATCDILDEDCQSQVMAMVRCFRGGDADVMPEVRVISEDEYVELVQGEPPTEEALAELLRFSRAMSLFRLSPAMPDYDAAVEEYASEIAAAYLTDEDSVVIIDRGDPLDSKDAVSTFAHELVHALQDREIGLNEFYNGFRPTLDATLAARALIEGEGTHYDVMIYAGLEGAYPRNINWSDYYTRYQLTMLLEGYEDEAPLVLSLVRFPYAFGGDFVTDQWLYAGGQRAVADLFESPPQSTADVITFSLLNETGAADVAEFRELSKLAPIEGYELVAYDELGSFVLDGFLHRLEVSDEVVLDGRVLWMISDGVTVLHNEEEDSVVAAWRLRFEEAGVPSEEEIAALRAALEAPDEDAPEPGDDVKARVFLDDRDLIIIASDKPLDATWLGDEVVWEPAPTIEEMADETPTAMTLCGKRCRLP